MSIGRYAARLEPEERESVVESAFFVALGAQGFGTISGESSPPAFRVPHTCLLCLVQASYQWRVHLMFCFGLLHSFRFEFGSVEAPSHVPPMLRVRAVVGWRRSLTRRRMVEIFATLRFPFPFLLSAAPPAPSLGYVQVFESCVGPARRRIAGCILFAFSRLHVCARAAIFVVLNTSSRLSGGIGKLTTRFCRLRRPVCGRRRSSPQGRLRRGGRQHPSQHRHRRGCSPRAPQGREDFPADVVNGRGLRAAKLKNSQHPTVSPARVERSAGRRGALCVTCLYMHRLLLLSGESGLGIQSLVSVGRAERERGMPNGTQAV